MANSGGASVRSARGSPWPLGCALLCLACCCCCCCAAAAASSSSVRASPSHGRRPICWQAIMNCQAEPECNYAYEHYIRACGPVLSGDRKKCPSHCISSLVQLNLTKNGPALEDCSCGHDAVCAHTKRAIEPCLPRTTSTGCTEARYQCQRDPQCGSAMHDYLNHCGKLFNGAVCTNACRNVITNMRKIPKGQQLDTCMCDGTERAICEFVKNSMKALCFDYEASGSDDDEEEEWEGVEGGPQEVEKPAYVESGASPPEARCVLTLLASILALLPLF